jgi:putative ABC transport system permease protein
MRWLAGLRERLRTVLTGARADRELAEEMRFHIDMEAERLERDEGLAAAAARRRAMLMFGGLDKHRAAVRDARGFGVLSGTSLDVKLGARMLRKYPGLTLAGGLALTIAVALAAAFFEFFNDMAHPRLPFPDAGRVVAVQLLDRSNAEQERRMLYDYEVWREEVTTIRDLSATSNTEYNVTTDEGRFTSLRAARLTPSALSIAGVAPILGRVFDATDERQGGPLPVLLGHDVWLELFDGDGSVLGRTLHLGEQPATVIGVMPAGFGFPTNQQLWLPLRARASLLAPRTGPNLSVYGRLAPGVTLDQAQAELDALGERMAVQHPATHEQLRPRVLRMQEVIGMGAVVRLMNVPFILFLLVVCANVATLVFARTATRAGELAVRSALGASRRRLLVQLVAEAMVLTSVATAAGLLLAQWGLRHGMALFWEVQQMAAPYFFDDVLSTTTIAYALGLSVLAAIVIGGVPALKATGRDLRPQLLGAGAGAMRFGSMSTAVIVLQVALCVAFLPPAILAARDLLPERDAAVRFPADQYLSGLITLAQDDEGGDVAAMFEAVKQRLAAQRGVAAAALAGRMPGMNHPIEPVQLASDTALLRVRVLAVDADLFDVVGARVIAGRTFEAGEYTGAAHAVIVDAAWAQRVFAGRSPVGERIRFTRRDEGDDTQWHEVVGVVEGMQAAIGPGSTVSLYRPLNPTGHTAVQFYLRTTEPPATLLRGVHAAVSSVHPRLGAADVKPLDEHWAPVVKADTYFVAGINVVGFIVVGFALIGIYALLSFTVAQRSREIAIRAALGADPRGVLRSVFGRAVQQIGLGVLIGAAIVSVAIVRTPAGAGLVAAVAALMLVFGLAGCALPALRALRIHPTDALKAE